MRLKALHDVIQASFGWQDYHLYEFEAGDRRYGIPDPDLDFDRKVRSARNVRLEALIAQGHTRLGYTYDFGDTWRHYVAIEAVEEGVPGALCPRLVAGERRGPPEDVGGPYGYFEFLEAFSLETEPRDYHARMIKWCGGGFDTQKRGLWLLGRRASRASPPAGAREWKVTRRAAGPGPASPGDRRARRAVNFILAQVLKERCAGPLDAAFETDDIATCLELWSCLTRSVAAAESKEPSPCRRVSTSSCA